MSSPMSSTPVPSQNYSHQSGFGQQHFEGFTDHLQSVISMNPNYSMQQNSMRENYAAHQIRHGFAARKSLMTEHLPFYHHQAPPEQYTQQHLNQGFEGSMIHLQPQQQLPTEQPLPAKQPQKIERQRVAKEGVLVVQLQPPLFGMGKPRLHWTGELHARFLSAVFELGGIFSATPRAILRSMNVKGMTLDHIKSHLQKVRTRKANDIAQNSRHVKAPNYNKNLSFAPRRDNANDSNFGL